MLSALRRSRSEAGQSDALFLGGIVLVVIGLFIGLIWGVMFIQGWKAVPPDKVMLHYTGGPIEGTHYVSVVQPGTGAKFYGLRDKFYMLPSTQRTYVISKNAHEGEEQRADFLSAPSSDNVMFTFEVAVYFKLNMKPEVLRRFMEQICLHDHCTDLSPGGGWDKMLRQYFRPQIDNAVRIEAEHYNRAELYKDPEVLVAIQKKIGTVLKERINSQLGGEYFCGPNSTVDRCDDFGFVLKNPTPPESVVAEYANTAAAQQAIVTAENNAQAKAAAAKGDADSQRIRAAAPQVPSSNVDYIRAQAMADCAKRPECKLTLIQGLDNVIVNGG